MRVYIKIKLQQAKNTAKNIREEAEKIAVAVVLAEILLVSGYAVGERYQLFDIFRHTEGITIVQARTPEAIKQATKTPEEDKADTIERIASTIWTRESTQGKNNYSKCEAIGKVNGIGYGIAGNGKYICFESHADEMRTLEGWIIAKQAQGMTETGLMCLYSGGNYKEC